MKKSIIIATLLTLTVFLTSFSASAQRSETSSKPFFNRVSVSYDNTNMDDGEESISLNGAGVEYTHGFGLSSTNPLFLEVGFKGKFNTGSTTYDSGTKYEESFTYKFFTFVAPVNVSYLFQINPDFLIAPYAGINFKLHASGKSEVSYDGQTDDDVNVFDKKDMGGDTWNRFQMGWQIGVGAYYSDFYLGISYGTDFLKMYDKNDFNINTGNLAVSLGYTF